MRYAPNAYPKEVWDRVWKMRQRGMSVRSIAEKTGLPYATVEHRICQRETSGKSHREVVKMPQEQIAALYAGRTY